MKPVLSLVIPVYNERGAVAETARQVLAELATWGEPTEVILVNDGSTDGTGDILKTLEGVRVIEHLHNKGYGAALKTGIRAAKGAYVAITDSDLTYPIGRLKDLLAEARRGQAMVVGSRTGTDVNIPLLRRFPKWVLTKLASYLAGRNIPDLNSGFRVFDRRALLPHLALMPNGFSFTTTITLVMLTRDEEVAYVSVNYLKREGQSKIRPIKDTLLFFQLVVRTVTLFQPLKVFMPLFLLTELAASLVFYVFYHWGPSWGMKVPDASIAIMAMTGVMFFTIGVLADLVSRRMMHLHELISHDLRE
ncbi:MAG: glycosyltransferase family 2 protein [Planctomycetota bacterium]